MRPTTAAAAARVVTILITSLTTVADLFSPATGIGPKSQFWGPVASSIVRNLGFATVLTLFMIPAAVSAASIPGMDAFGADAGSAPPASNRAVGGDVRLVFRVPVKPLNH